MSRARNRRARANAEAAGVADRITFVQQDVTAGFTEQYDVITTFAVVHETADPGAFLGAIHRALVPTGTYLCPEFRVAETLEGKLGP
jgi:2-polyprenyl-3-methyl-5-hydroxy-6-metoxy-1,4-benzoquinol methylase